MAQTVPLVMVILMKLIMIVIELLKCLEKEKPICRKQNLLTRLFELVSLMIIVNILNLYVIDCLSLFLVSPLVGAKLCRNIYLVKVYW